MIIKSYEVKKNKSKFININFTLLYGENLGLKKDIKNFITSELKKKDEKVEIFSYYENEIIDDEKKFYDSVYSGSLFSNNKIIIINEATDKIFKKIEDI